MALTGGDYTACPQFAQLGVELLDLGPRLPADAEALYYPRDRHLTAERHRFVAREIHRFLRARDLL